ncbi:hypothetical protein Drorol1_Dr00022032 [Drosera rotundifolia]
MFGDSNSLPPSSSQIVGRRHRSHDHHSRGRLRLLPSLPQPPKTTRPSQFAVRCGLSEGGSACVATTISTAGFLTPLSSPPRQLLPQSSASVSPSNSPSPLHLSFITMNKPNPNPNL